MEEPWMMFTQYQGQELIDNTTYEWVTINGVNGGKFTNKTDSNKYIFLPPGGYWLESTLDNIGSIGYYLSSTPYKPELSIWFMFIRSYTQYMHNYLKYIGYSIRPVAPPKPW